MGMSNSSHQYSGPAIVDQHKAHQSAEDWGKILAAALSKPTPNMPAQEGKGATAGSIALDFLLSLDSGGTHLLATIDPTTKGMETRTFAPCDRAEMKAWIDTHNGHRNLYYLVNEPATNGRRKREDIESVRGVFTDVDPQDGDAQFDTERWRLLGLAGRMRDEAVCPPSFAVDSGNGVQFVWLLKDKIDAQSHAAEAEAQSRGIAAALGGDNGVFDLARILRLPGTLNLPDAGKRAKGRTVQPARLLWKTGRAYTLEEIARRFAPAASGAIATDRSEDMAAARAELDISAIFDAETLKELPSDLRMRLEDHRLAHPRFDRLLERGEHDGTDKSGSGRRFSLASWMHKLSGYCINDYARVLGAWTLAINPGDVLENKLTEREIARCWVNARPASSDEQAAAFFEKIGEHSSGSVPSTLAPSNSENLTAPRATKSRLVTVSGRVEATSIPTREWVIHPRLQLYTVVQCVGEPGISKSTFGLRDALIVATADERILRGSNASGKPIAGERLHRPGPVIFYDAEDPLNEMERRLAAAQRHYGVPETMRHPIALWSGVTDRPLSILERCDRENGPLKRAEGLAELEREIAERKAVLVILGPQISLMRGGNENSNDDMNALLQELANLAERRRVCIQLNHHTAKSTREASGDMGAGRGAFAAVGKVRGAFTLTHVTGDRTDEKAWGLKGTKDLIRLDMSKANYAGKPDEPLVFRRVSVSVGNGSGIRREAAEALDDTNPAEALRMNGDTAPVLDLVDVDALANRNRPVVQERAQSIARFVAEAMAKDLEVALADIWAGVGARMREAGLTRAAGRATVCAEITSALRLMQPIKRPDGQFVRIRMRQKGGGQTAPWCLSIEAADNPEAAA
jgi:hypothetical protein